MLARPDVNAGLKTFGIGMGVEILLIGCGFAMNSLLGISEMSPEQILSSSTMIYSCGLGILGYAIYGALGAVYGWFYRRADSASEVGKAALGGAIAVAVTALVAQIISLFLNIITGQMARVIDMSLAAQGVNAGDMQGLVMIGAVGGALIGLCIAIVLAAGLGAAGAAIYTAIARRNQPASPTPV